MAAFQLECYQWYLVQVLQLILTGSTSMAFSFIKMSLGRDIASHWISLFESKGVEGISHWRTCTKSEYFV